MLLTFIKDLFFSSSKNLGKENRTSESNKRMKVLNVGGNAKTISIGALYDGWQQDLLDIDSRGNPDILCDARELQTLAGNVYDSIYCSHNLEHYFEHDVERVLNGFKHILKEDGFAYIRVPDMEFIFQKIVHEHLDIEDTLYMEEVGPITVKDVIYGYGAEIRATGNDFYAHKTGFTNKSLTTALEKAGFKSILCVNPDEELEIRAIVFKQIPVAGSYAPAKNNPVLSLGNEYLSMGYFSVAEKCYRYLIDLYPNDIDANISIGYSLIQQHEYVKAEKYIAKAVLLDNENADAWYLSGLINQAKNNLEQAISCFKKSLVINVHTEQIYNDLYHAYLISGNKTAAEQLMLEAISINSTAIDPHLNLADLYLDDEKYSQSIESYQQVLKLEPSHKQATAGLEKALASQRAINQ